MPGRLLRAGIYGFLILCLLGAPFVPASAAVALDAAQDQTALTEAGNWHPLSFLYSLFGQLLGNDQNLVNGAQESSSGESTDPVYSAGEEPEIPPFCVGPGIEPAEAC